MNRRKMLALLGASPAIVAGAPSTRRRLRGLFRKAAHLP